MSKKLFLVCRGVGASLDPLWAREDRGTAYSDAQKLINKFYENLGGYETFQGLPPIDASHLVPWWNHKCQVGMEAWLVTIKEVDLKDWAEPCFEPC